MKKSAVATTGEIRPVEAARALGVELGYVYLLLRSGKLEGRGQAMGGLSPSG